MLLLEYLIVSSALDTPEWTRRLKPEASSELTKVRQLYLAFYQAIANGDLHSNLHLPSSRALSAQLGLGRNTVIAVYNQLESEGLIRSDGRRGTHVNYEGTQDRTTVSNYSNPIATSKRANAIHCDSTAFSDLAPGMPDPSLFPVESWRRAMRKAGRLETDHLGYDPKPLPELQQAVARYLSIYRSLTVDPARILITSSTRQSLLVAAMLYTDPGDVAWVESPGYRGAIDAFTTAGLTLHAMHVDKAGANIDLQASHPAPALMYLTPCFHYPTGAALSMQRRRKILDFAIQHRSIIFEDDYDSEFRDHSEARPALAAQARTWSTHSNQQRSSKHKQADLHNHRPGNAIVLHAGTFSKLVFPAARVAWLVLPGEDIYRGQACLKTIGGGHNRIAQATITEILESGAIAKHLQTARRVYAQRRDNLISSLNDSAWFKPIAECGGSLSLVANLTNTVDRKRFTQCCRTLRLGVQPLEGFMWEIQQREEVSALVLGAGNISTLRIPNAIERLESALDQSGVGKTLA